MKRLNTSIVFCLLLILSASEADARGMRPRKEKENPPRLRGIQYHWCQPPTEKQLKQRSKMGMNFDREVKREEGERKYGSRAGKWVFWDKFGKKMAEGECQPPPALREGQEHGLWTYWDVDGRKVTLNWTYGKFDGEWTLYDPQGVKRWQFHVSEGKERKELFSDEKYLKAEGLWREGPIGRPNLND